MTFLQIAGIVIGSIAGLGALIAGAGYGIGKFIEGKNARSKDDYDLMITRLDSLQRLCEQQQNDINRNHDDLKKHTQEIGRLQGVNEEKEKKIRELMDLLANRDPALTEYIKFGREAILEFKKGMELIISKLGEK